MDAKPHGRHQALIPAHKLRAICVLAGADPRTVKKVARGATNTQPNARARIEDALRREGLGHLVRAEGEGIAHGS
jgi:hypothetical protein